MEHVFKIGHLFSGVGGGALGCGKARARWGNHSARFETVGGQDIDELSCQDFESLTGAPALRGDLRALTPADLRRAWGKTAPDAVLLSPPCKGFSALLSAERAKDEKYITMNKLLLDGLFLLMSTWNDPPALIFVENVPRITSRGRDLVDQVRATGMAHGYAVTPDDFHNCGELGGLAQNRMRWFMIMRHRSRIPQFVYKPPKKRVRACGEVIGPMPFPGDEVAGGPLHRLPKISWLNWVRLALIPAGGDWRDLRGVVPDGKQRREVHRRHKVAAYDKPIDTVVGPGHGSVENVADPKITDPRFKDKTWWQHVAGVSKWEEPFATVTGTASLHSGSNAVADPRFARSGSRSGALGVIGWDDPAPTVTGNAEATGSNTPASVADPRIPLHENGGRHENKYSIEEWDKPAKTVTGARPVTSGGGAIADPRFIHVDRVVGWNQAVGCVTSSPAPSSGAIAAADPRIVPSGSPNNGSYGVVGWDETAGVVTGRAGVPTGKFAVQDPRDICKGWADRYGVLRWDEAAATISGALGVDNGKAAVADPRFPHANKPPLVTPIIVAKDGTWHRPLTTLELAALQSFPTMVDGKPLVLAGNSATRWREAIGNAIPPDAAEAIAEQILLSLLVSKLKGFVLSAQEVWVQPGDVV